MKIKKILVSHQKPETNNSPYFDIAKKFNLTIDFVPFCTVEPVTLKEIRTSKIDFLAFNSIVFSNKTAIDHFFKLCEEMKVSIPDSMKYFCVTESIAFYLQKYIVYRKRKIFYGNNKISDLTPLFNKHCQDKFLVPGSDTPKKYIIDFLTSLKLNFKTVSLYKNIELNISETIETIDHDIIVFYSPLGLKSFVNNFPKFKQKDIVFASFGEETSKAVFNAGYKLNIKVPSPETPSMSMALSQYISQNNSKNIKKKK